MLKRDNIKTTRNSDECGVYFCSEIRIGVRNSFSQLQIDSAEFDIETAIHNNETDLWLKIYKEPLQKALIIQSLLTSFAGSHGQAVLTDTRITAALKECKELMIMLLKPND